MSNKINDGGPAFPVTLFEGQTLGDGTANGMTLRDYFAAKAMQANYAAYMDEMRQDAESEMFRGDWEGDIACFAYRMADAMLRARGSK